MDESSTPATGRFPRCNECLAEDSLGFILKPEDQYFVVFHELDLDFSLGNEDYVDSMVGLILAAQNFHLWARDIDATVMPVVLLRDDIYASLQFADKNKITHGLLETIHWDAEMESPNSLKALMDTRIEVLLDGPKSHDPWSLVFDDQEMRGTQHKYLHMVQRTYLRPRDLIHFGNLCLTAARERVGSHAAPTDRIENQDVTTARTPYSGYLRAELADEIHPHFPDW